MSSDEEARSTERPPAYDDEGEGSPARGPDIASAILRAKSNAARSTAPGGPASATAKINKFDLAQALALTTADGETPPSSSKPLREDDAPFVGGEVEVIGEEEASSGVASAKPAELRPSMKPTPAVGFTPAGPIVADEGEEITPRPRDGRLPVVILAAVVGLIVIVYAYLTTR